MHTNLETVSAVYKELTIEHTLGRVVDINTHRQEVGRKGWVRWRVLEYYGTEHPDPLKRDRVRACLAHDEGQQSNLHWPTIVLKITEGSAYVE